MSPMPNPISRGEKLTIMAGELSYLFELLSQTDLEAVHCWCLEHPNTIQRAHELFKSISNMHQDGVKVTY